MITAKYHHSREKAGDMDLLGRSVEEVSIKCQAHYAIHNTKHNDILMDDYCTGLCLPLVYFYVASVYSLQSTVYQITCIKISAIPILEPVFKNSNKSTI